MAKLDIPDLLLAIAKSVKLSPEFAVALVIDEISELRRADTDEERICEFRDSLFALLCLLFATAGDAGFTSASLSLRPQQEKILKRLREFGNLSHRRPIAAGADIFEIEFDVVHLAFGNFRKPWKQGDPYKNGTEDEIARLTTIGVSSPEAANHLIVTFDADDVPTFDYLEANKFGDRGKGNTVRCCIPDFVYNECRDGTDGLDLPSILGAQLLSVLDHVRLKQNCIFHLHSWESALCLSAEVSQTIARFPRVFSPYLTIAGLAAFAETHGRSHLTLSEKRLEFARIQEQIAVEYSNVVVVESEQDRARYREMTGANRVKVVSFMEQQRYEVRYQPRSKVLSFVAGGRAVAEKGFLELIEEVPEIMRTLDPLGYSFTISILCREQRRGASSSGMSEAPKGSGYLVELERSISRLSLSDHVTLAPKVSIDRLMQILSEADGMIAPSLFDPFCLMPIYAARADRPAFVSKYAGVSALSAHAFVFDPRKSGDLASRIASWLAEKSEFTLEQRHTPYALLYRQLGGVNANR